MCIGKEKCTSLLRNCKSVRATTESGFTEEPRVGRADGGAFGGRSVRAGHGPDRVLRDLGPDRTWVGEKRTGRSGQTARFGVVRMRRSGAWGGGGSSPRGTRKLQCRLLARSDARSAHRMPCTRAAFSEPRSPPVHRCPLSEPSSLIRVLSSGRISLPVGRCLHRTSCDPFGSSASWIPPRRVLQARRFASPPRDGFALSRFALLRQPSHLQVPPPRTAVLSLEDL